MHRSHFRKNAGFTLVELAIVLVIIGLVVTAILLGQEMINNARQRKLISEIDSIRAAVNTFRLKYNGIPGDIPNASMFWANCDPTPSNCNGNNDSKIGVVDFAPPAQVEELRAWQQLGDAGLIPWRLTGVSNVTPPLKLDVSVPRSAFVKNNSGYRFSFAGGLLLANAVQFVNPEGQTNFWGASLSTEEAFAIDQKHDDGYANKGNIRVYSAFTNNHTVLSTACTTSALTSNTYTVDAQFVTPYSISPACALVFLLF